MVRLLSLLLGATSIIRYTSAFDYGLSASGDLSLKDVETGIGEIKTIFINEDALVTVTGIEWTPSESNVTGRDVLRWETSVDGKVQATGEFNLTSDELGSRELPDSMEVGTIRIPDAGRHEITVTLYVDETESSSSAEFEAFRPGVAIVPLIVVLVLALATQMVEFSLLFAVFVGACMVSGNIKDGFKTTLDDYLLNAVADSGHAYVYLFTLFLSGMVSYYYFIMKVTFRFIWTRLANPYKSTIFKMICFSLGRNDGKERRNDWLYPNGCAICQDRPCRTGCYLCHWHRGIF